MSIINLKRFEDKYKYLLGEKFSGFHEALQLPPLKYFRINSVRNINYLKELDDRGVKYLPDRYFGDFYKLTDDISVSDTIAFLTGGIYIQNPSSIIPVDMLSRALKNNEEPVVLDMCAAPGGKTTGLSEKIARRGLIVANEVSKSRLKSLHFNLEKYGAWNVKTTSVDGRVVGKMFPETFDGILLDAPCSNENKIFRNPEVSRNWSEDLVKKMQKLQTELIFSAYEALKPGGVLVYSTCTFSVEENEDVIKSLLDTYQDIKFIRFEADFSYKGLSGDGRIDDNVFRILPEIENMKNKMQRTTYDGFFSAALRKPGAMQQKASRKESKNKYTQTFQRFFNKELPQGVFREVKGLIFMENNIDPGIKFFKTGLKAGKFAGDDIEISSQFLWEFGCSAKEPYIVRLSIDEADNYLKGNDINKVPPLKGNNLFAFYDNLPVGTVKGVNGRLKNKLDRYFLYGK
ncbi:MAG TPA: hypothetical protein DHM44_00230 [Flexistipes sinusarabici]|uniref:SAM-dependent MTase RsmB/NOP-type domain-containing protein n=1 Tax=Flexistipes sinusarabici TaxID=2352 RepID=A0A3D5Q9X9_FLESI|nr:hypothetical protein [Flexistipes sinusarabici]